MVDETEHDDGEERERYVEEVAVTEATLYQRIITPRAWGTASLLGTAERGALLMVAFTGMPYFLCWRLPDREDVTVEFLHDDDPRAQATVAAGEEAEENVSTWILPGDIDEERVRYPARWGQPSAVLDAWFDGGPLFLTFPDEEHLLRWSLDDDMLLALIADDTL